jgi:hypothetical protein
MDLNENTLNNKNLPHNSETPQTTTIETLATAAKNVEQATKPSGVTLGSALDRIEHTLYDPKKKQDDFAVHQSRERVIKELPSSWGEASVGATSLAAKETMSLGAKLLILSLIVLLGALSFTAWRVLSSRNVVSSANIDVALDVTPYIEGGEEVPLYVTVHNRNTVSLEASSVTLMYKQGSGVQDEEEKINEKKELGTLTAGTSSKQDFLIALYGSEAEQRDITVKFEYKVAGSNAVFSKIATVPVILKTPPMSVTIDGPSLLSVGQSGVFSFTVKNNTSTTSSPALLMLALPNIFTVEDASPKSLTRSTVWGIPSLKSGSTHTVTVTGSLSGDVRDFTSYVIVE